MVRNWIKPNKSGFHVMLEWVFYNSILILVSLKHLQTKENNITESKKDDIKTTFTKLFYTRMVVHLSRVFSKKHIPAEGQFFFFLTLGMLKKSLFFKNRKLSWTMRATVTRTTNKQINKAWCTCKADVLLIYTIVVCFYCCRCRRGQIKLWNVELKNYKMQPSNFTRFLFCPHFCACTGFAWATRDWLKWTLSLEQMYFQQGRLTLAKLDKARQDNILFGVSYQLVYQNYNLLC